MLTAMCLAAGCSSTPTVPSVTTPPAPKITCPVPQTVISPNGLPVTVTFAAPIVAGGTTPVATACAPVSGSKFPVGVDTVACTASDSQQRTDACTFAVTVLSAAPTPSPLLSLTRFTAFGDSITEGKITTGSLRPDSVAPCVEGDDRNRPTAYPQLLSATLKQRYPAQAQAITVTDHGCGGEKAADAVASGRFVSVLTLDSPQVLMLLEGANDLSGTDTTSITSAVGALKSMVDEAKRRGIVVFLGTLLPQRATPVAGAPYRATGPTLVQPANAQITALATSEGVFLVDLYQAFGGSPDPYIDTDGLHPTLAGHQVIASAFYTSITQHLEISGTASTQARR